MLSPAQLAPTSGIETHCILKRGDQEAATVATSEYITAEREAGARPVDATPGRPHSVSFDDTERNIKGRLAFTKARLQEILEELQ